MSNTRKELQVMETVNLVGISPSEKELIELALELKKYNMDKAPSYELKAISNINHPDYYNRYDTEVVEMARKIWGTETMKKVAQVTAFIYRMRAGIKPENPIEKDLAKEQWWLDYGRSLDNVQED